MHELPEQFIYKLIFVPKLGLSLLLARKEIYLVNQTNQALVSYDLKKFAMRIQLMQFCNFDNDTRTLNLLVSGNDKENGSILTVLGIMIAENKDKKSYQLIPISKVPIHPSICASPTELIDIQYLLSPGT